MENNGDMKRSAGDLSAVATGEQQRVNIFYDDYRCKYNKLG
jgi:hypothetical protein